MARGPCDPDDVEAHARVAGQTTIALAVGESLYQKHDFADFVRARAAHVLQADATHIAGVTEWLAIAGLADCHGLPLIPHHSDFCQLHQHLVAAVRGAPMLEYPWRCDIFATPVEITGSRFVVVPSGVGAGTAIADAAFDRYRVY